ncbi:hypothetical protein KR49_01145 [Synechococcus sp. KORDI-49]|uniref:hypothetical protein n=1 Tax=Synechococcus sp. KORDI-49 TaxID=585423 RepID=UPI0004E0AEA4|nr:hypothetical protein [Synechococcus sp. KORDI-49]AII45070.1 hypothetical protein KR49_01145 [Synechococcus sp. KORDI-49]
MIFFKAIDFFHHLHGDHNPQISEAVWSLRVMEKHIRVEYDNFVFHEILRLNTQRVMTSMNAVISKSLAPFCFTLAKAIFWLPVRLQAKQETAS